MNNSTDQNPVISDELWRTWAHLGKRRDEAAARKRNRFAGFAMAILAIGVASYYFLTVR